MSLWVWGGGGGGGWGKTCRNSNPPGSDVLIENVDKHSFGHFKKKGKKNFHLLQMCPLPEPSERTRQPAHCNRRSHLLIKQIWRGKEPAL